MGHALACLSVAPMPTNDLICHAGINTQQIIAASKGDDGGGVLLQYWQFGTALEHEERQLVF